MVQPQVQLPYIFLAGSNSLCDLVKENCSLIDVYGQDFEEGGICIVLRNPYPDSNSSGSSSTKYEVPFHFIAPGHVQCPIRDPALEQSLTIHMANGERRESNPALLTVYNSSCQTCASPGKCGPLKGVCPYGEEGVPSRGCAGQGEGHRDNPCLVCTQEGSWTTKSISK